jgi:hypothetical protein
MSHRDVILKDETGSGKTFGLIAALLSKKHPPLYISNKKLSNTKPETASFDTLDDDDFKTSSMDADSSTKSKVGAA